MGKPQWAIKYTKYQKRNTTHTPGDLWQPDPVSGKPPGNITNVMTSALPQWHNGQRERKVNCLWTHRWVVRSWCNKGSVSTDSLPKPCMTGYKPAESLLYHETSVLTLLWRIRIAFCSLNACTMESIMWQRPHRSVDRHSSLHFSSRWYESARESPYVLHPCLSEVSLMLLDRHS